MGLDAVELIIRTEEFYGITIVDSEAAPVRTVGGFYQLVCHKLGVPPLASPITSESLPLVSEKERQLLFLQKWTPLSPLPELLPWSPQSIWDSLVALIVDQLCVSPGEVAYHVSFAEELRVD